MLGFFKHRNADDWMEQLFKHEGMCVWSDEEYAFMKNARKAWPGGCVNTGQQDAKSNTLYYNIKPMQNGRMGVGLYTNVYCLKEYPADIDEIENIVGNIFQGAGSGGSGDNADYDFSMDILEESMDRWNSAFDVWHTCHPCVAYDLENTGGDKYTQDNCYDDDYYANYDRRLGGEQCPAGDVFECYDDAGYTNVNQVSGTVCTHFLCSTIIPIDL